MKKEELFTYREIATQKWIVSLPRQLRTLWAERDLPKIEVSAQLDETALEGMIEPRLPVVGLWLQIRELYDEARNPRPKAKITAKADPAALDGLFEARLPFVSLYYQIRAIVDEIRNPSEIVITAAPVEVEPLWSVRDWRKPAAGAIGGYLLVILLIFGGFGVDAAPTNQIVETFIPLYLPADLMLPPEEDTSAGGGGGGKETLTLPSAGPPPKAADEQFVPPQAEPPLNLNPILVAVPTVVAPQLASLQPISLPNLGDPMNGIPAPPSSGPGVGGGIGIGQGRGVGEGDGPGQGAGSGGGFGGGVFAVGGGVTAPQIVYRIDPTYSEDARKARYQGTIVIEAIVRKDGSVEVIRVVRSVGFGLEERAMNALRQWKFSPARRNGQPVDVAVNIEVNFRLR